MRLVNTTDSAHARNTVDGTGHSVLAQARSFDDAKTDQQHALYLCVLRASRQTPVEFGIDDEFLPKLSEVAIVAAFENELDRLKRD